MKKNKYPRIGEKFTSSPHGLCAICNQPKAEGRVTVQVDWFRGNDFVYKVHLACIKGLKDKELLEVLHELDNAA